MMTFWCRNCGKTLEARDEHVGKKCKCPRCGKINTVPVAQPVGPTKESKPGPVHRPAPAKPDVDSVSSKFVMLEAELAREAEADAKNPSVPVVNDEEQTKYTCMKCGEKLETPASMDGLEDQCPFCGNIQTVPKNKSQQRQHSDQKAREETLETSELPREAAQRSEELVAAQRHQEEMGRSMIQFWCRNCGKILEARDEHIGKKCKCPRCRKINTVPGI